MFFSRYIFLFLLPTYDSSSHINQNPHYRNNNEHQRIKRLFNRKSTKSRIVNDNLLKSSQQYNDHLHFSNYHGKPNVIGYTQQDLTEIKRILSKKIDDYYGILNIQNDSSQDKIMIAYRKLSLIVYPIKTNVPGAAEAAQRLNRARVVLLKKFESQSKDLYQHVTKTVINEFSTLSNKKNDKISNIVTASISISTSSQLLISQTEKQSTKISSIDDKSHYFLLAFIVLAVGIIVFITYWKKRQYRIYPLNFLTTLNKSKISPTYDSPESDDGDSIHMYDTTNISMNKQKKAINLIE